MQEFVACVWTQGPNLFCHNWMLWGITYTCLMSKSIFLVERKCHLGFYFVLFWWRNNLYHTKMNTDLRYSNFLFCHINQKRILERSLNCNFLIIFIILTWSILHSTFKILNPVTLLSLDCLHVILIIDYCWNENLSACSS